MKRGEVRWAAHPDWPRRPALLLTRDEAIERLNEVFVVLATTNIRGLPTEVELGAEDGTDHTFPPRQGGGRWFEPSIVHSGRYWGFGNGP